MKEGETIEEYYQEIDEIVAKLVGVDQIVDEEELIYIVRNGLPLNQASFVSNFGADLFYGPRPTYGELVECMQAEDFWRLFKRRDVHEEALLTSHFHCSSHWDSFRHNSCSNCLDWSQCPLSQSSSQTAKPIDNCNYCGKVSHQEVDCNLKKVKEQINQLQLWALAMRKPRQAHLVEHMPHDVTDHSKEESENSSSQEVNLTSYKEPPKWLFDLGTSNHMTCDCSTLDKFSPSSSKFGIFMVSGAHLGIAEKGAIILDQNKVTNVFYVPSVTKKIKNWQDY